VDLIANANGAKLGGLSIAPTPVFVSSSNATSFNNATSLSYLIDSTPNPAEQTTFYMRQFDDQTILRAELSTNPATQAVHDLLVSLQVSLSSQEPLCATFNPLAQDVQTFGLAICMDSDGARPSRGASQAFRYSPGTGVVRPFYGLGGEGVQVLAQAVADRIEWMDGPNYSNSNATALVAPGSTPLPMSVPDPLLQPMVHLDPNSTVALNSMCTDPDCSTAEKRGPPILAVQPKSGRTRALVVGDTEFVSQFAVSSDKVEKDEGVMMLFRRVYEAPSEVEDVTEDVRMGLQKRESEKGREGRESGVLRGGEADSDMGLLAEDDDLEDDPFEESGQRETEDYGTVTPGIKARTTGTILGYSGLGTWQGGPARGDVKTIEDPESSVYHTPTGSPIASPQKSYSSPGTSSNPTANSQHLDEFDSSESNPDDRPVPKPVINVAYFGDSGRSAPVPPEDQADNTRPILIADPGKKLGSAPMTLAAADGRGKDGEGSVVGVYLVGPKAAKIKDQTVSVANVDGRAENLGNRLPVDASD
jgi:hypothetical protein